MENGIQHSVEATPQYIDQVFRILLDSIVAGELKPGQRVRQLELAERFGVSRQPVSHALQLLKHHGLVLETGKQGVTVAPVDPAYILHLYRARAALEAAAVSHAAARIEAGQVAATHIDELKAALAAGHEAAAASVPLPVLVKADARFHDALYHLSGNPVIERMMAGQWPHLMRSMMAVLDDTGVPERAWVEHEAIAQAVLAGDAARAHDLISSHLQRAGNDLHERLLGRQPPA